MSAAILQGVPVTTLDIDLWVDLPERQYMRVIRIALREGASMLRNTVVELSDGTLLNFLFSITGLGSFGRELEKANALDFQGITIPVMPLESIRASKMAVMRPKDAVHIVYLEQTINLKKKVGGRSK